MNLTIHKKLKTLRIEKGYTQQEIADRLNITRSTVSNYETGRRTPQLKDLKKFAEFYRVSLEFFDSGLIDDDFDLISRARTLFESDSVPRERKEEIFQEFMKLYLDLK